MFKNEDIFVDDKNHHFEFISINVICKGIVEILKIKLNPDLLILWE